MITDIDILSGHYCPYCANRAVHVKDTEVYKGGGFGGMIYLCSDCDAYVGCHKERPDEALGRLANAELRQYKQDAHAVFDPLWRRKMTKGFSKSRARAAAYAWLSEQIGIPREYCHIGMFDVEECKKVILICQPYFKTHV